jgi:putative hydrolase of the HAD superfamily
VSVKHLDTVDDGIRQPPFALLPCCGLPCPPVISAVLWDFGGVILTSPFEAFARYEREEGLPDGFIRRINSTNPHDNAWARLERGELDRSGFADAFEAEAHALGSTLAGAQVLELLAGEVRPEMVTALARCRKAGLRTACLTNNIMGGEDASEARAAEVAGIMALFDVVVESSVVGVRKPEPAFYEIACRLLDVEPAACVFLDDLGINLKPARAMGMTTIKVDEPDVAIAELEQVLGLVLT